MLDPGYLSDDPSVSYDYVSTQYFILNLEGSFGLLSNKFIIYDNPLLYDNINLRSSIVFCLSSKDIYFSLGISLSCSFLIVSELFCGEVVATFKNLSTILSPIKSQVPLVVLYWASN